MLKKKNQGYCAFVRYDSDVKNNVDKKKMDWYFTYESRDTLSLFLFLTVKTMTKLNLERSNKFEIETIIVI